MKMGSVRCVTLPLRIAAIFLMLTYLLLQGRPVFAAGATLYIDPMSSLATREYLSANVRLSAENNNVSFVQFGVSYDVSKLEFIATEQSGSPLTRPLGGGGSGTVSVGAGSRTDRVNGDVPVINLKFKVLMQTGSTSLKFNNPQVYNDSYVNVATSTAGAVYNFGEPTNSTDVEPDPTVQPSVTMPSITPSIAKPKPAGTTKVTQNTPTTPVSSPVTHETSMENQLTVKDEDTLIPPALMQEVEPRKYSSGSVFLKTPQTRFAVRAWLGAHGKWLVLGVAAIALASGVFILRQRIRNAIRGLMVWRHVRSYEIVPPLALLRADDDTGDQEEQSVPVPYIPVAEPSANVSSEETKSGTPDWAYDINSPLMNTL